VPDVLRSKVAVFVDLYHKTQQLKAQADSLLRRASQLQKLAAASVAVNACQSVERMLQTLTDAARDIIGCHQAITLFLGDPRLVAGPGDPRPEGTTRLATASYSDKLATWKDKPLNIDTVASTLLAQSRVPVRMSVSELHVHPDWEIVRKLNLPMVTTGILTAPLLGRDGTHLGVIRLADRLDGDFSADDQAVLLQLAQIGAVTIENMLFAYEREANRLKDEFLATLSHELRTPLHAMFGWVQLLRTESSLSEEVNHGLEVIERNVNAQSKLIEDLLDVSRITTGKLRISRKQVSLAGIVEAAVDSARPLATEKHVHLHAAISPCPLITGDADRMQQVVWNLLSNAIKFTPKGGKVTVTLNVLGDEAGTGTTPAASAGVGADVGSGSGGLAEIRVADTGVGIDPKFLPFVFDRFRQADASSTRKHGGLGIGLTIVRHIVELHGGSVHATSGGNGGGSVFTVRLPLPAQADGGGSGEPDAPDATGRRQGNSLDGVGLSAAEVSRMMLPMPSIDGPAETQSTDRAAAIDLTGAEVLLVEDEADARNLLAEVLRRAGASVYSAGSAAEAFAALEKKNFDIVVSDIAMPDEDGYSLLKRVRNSDFACAGMPAIALTAYAREEDRARALAAGFDVHVSKPVSPATFLATVSHALTHNRRAVRSS
jgi:signal transduction histidine kinase/ActR/RegA family two-component response regulator